ncbi:MAG TPA: hypothetical protein VJG30_03025 [Candidatus Nanoarchaeia archaeon]|nr:hypothetical protein [Candidatus Nanoarchaeia archaeon]
MAVEVTVKKWGNSMGVVLPIDLVERQDIREEDKILIEVVKKADLKDLFGSLRIGISGQKFKNLVRKGWKK